MIINQFAVGWMMYVLLRSVSHSYCHLLVLVVSSVYTWHYLHVIYRLFFQHIHVNVQLDTLLALVVSF